MTFLVESMGQIEIDVFWKTPSFNIPLKEALVKIVSDSEMKENIRVSCVDFFFFLDS